MNHESAVDHDPAAELRELAQPVADAPEAAAEAGAVMEETWRAAWGELIALLHDKVGSVDRQICVLCGCRACHCGPCPGTRCRREAINLQASVLASAQGYFEAGAAAGGPDQPWGPTKRAWLSMARDRAYLIYAIERGLVADIAKLDLPYTDRKVYEVTKCIWLRGSTCSVSCECHARVVTRATSCKGIFVTVVISPC